jgi:hypothetical protein
MSAKQTIHELATRHGIVREYSQLDERGDKITELADNEVQLDETEWLLVKLSRAEILMGKENTLLHAQYLQERQT